MPFKTSKIGSFILLMDVGWRWGRWLCVTGTGCSESGLGTSAMAQMRVIHVTYLLLVEGELWRDAVSEGKNSDEKSVSSWSISDDPDLEDGLSKSIRETGDWLLCCEESLPLEKESANDTDFPGSETALWTQFADGRLW